LIVYHASNILQDLVATAQRLALLAAGERQAQKREPLLAQEKPEKRGAYQPSSARCVGRLFMGGFFLSAD